jgi:hypothetical protein
MYWCFFVTSGVGENVSGDVRAKQQSRRRCAANGFAFVPHMCRPLRHRLGCRTGTEGEPQPPAGPGKHNAPAPVCSGEKLGIGRTAKPPPNTTTAPSYFRDYGHVGCRKDERSPQQARGLMRTSLRLQKRAHARPCPSLDAILTAIRRALAGCTPGAASTKIGDLLWGSAMAEEGRITWTEISAQLSDVLF